ncbi:peptide deformylase [Candidatus Uhrbacteria bacterium]|nr:peptide deformylase [Candidatus Uhrbacteria bacterium]
MSNLPILILPDPALRIPSMEVPISEWSSSRLRKLIEDLKETMAIENGVGIAAPQVGVRERVIIVDSGQGPQAFINPHIIQKSFRKIESEEGCLSVPGVFGMVRRHRSVVIEAFDEEGRSVTIRAKQFPAIVFQHEIDHLDGILFVDRVTRYTKHPKI